MTRFAERFLEKGRQEGLEKGLEQGIERGIEQGIGQGEARVLLRLLTLKFGPLPEAVQTRVDSADADTLLRWSERVLTAESLNDVLR
jgi:predicted transposase YdaD